jgi:hypothetical protein
LLGVFQTPEGDTAANSRVQILSFLGHITKSQCQTSRSVSGGGNVDENRRFEDPVRLTVKN